MSTVNMSNGALGARPGFGRRLLRNGAFLVGAVLIAVIALATIFAPWIAPNDPFMMLDMPGMFPGQSDYAALGTDSLGRDILSQLLWGGRVSLYVGVVSAAISVGIGIVVGAVSGYAGGWVDIVLTRLTELFQTIPSFLLVVIILAIGNPSAGLIALATGLASWPVVARLARSQFRALSRSEFVLAGENVGYGPVRLIFLEILPNAIAPIVVTVSVLVANAILIEAGVSFLGLGDPQRISWGTMIGDGRSLIRTAWHLTAIPGLAISLTVLALNIMGDGLNDALNPRD